MCLPLPKSYILIYKYYKNYSIIQIQISTAAIILVEKTTICFKNTLVYEIILKYLNFKLD